MRERFDVSFSVRAAFGKAPISASDLAWEIFKPHPEYASGLAEKLELHDTPSKKSSDIWIDEIGLLFRPEQIPDYRLDGRMVIIGLSLLEPELRRQLNEAGAWEHLIKEMHRPLFEVLTEKGKELYAAYRYTIDSGKEHILPSYSVKKALGCLPSQEPISAAQLSREIIKQHSEYAKGKAVSVSMVDTAKRFPAEKWLEDIRTLFDFFFIEKNTKSEGIESASYRNEPPQLHGRLVIIGLCLLDTQLRQQLERKGFFLDLIGELHEPLHKILTQRGRMLYQLPDSVPNWDDNAIDQPQKDLLGRAAFADYLFARISMIPPENSEAYIMHLFGPWGSGKSTVLKFLSLKLKTSGNWLVVDYNAWQNQHIDPPWWSLMDGIFQSLKKQNPYSNLKGRVKLYWWQIREYWWRFGTGHMTYIIGLIVLFWILAIILAALPYNIKEQESDTLAFIATNFDKISKIMAFIATIWGFVIAANRSLLLGSSQAARDYIRLTSDPMLKVKEHLVKSIKKLEPMRLAVLIDDLDRCHSRYVVELLEGILTLFREANIVIVVAADRRWLNASYEQSYEGLNTRISEPGKPLGALFLEKAFRFSTPVPGFSEDLKNRLWHHLLQIKSEQTPDMNAADLAEARKKVSEAPSEADLLQLTENVNNRAIIERAVVRLASPEIEERLEHFLMPYSEFLEANPRAMKRLVNSYSANRALDLLSQTRIDRHQLALWTIIQSRWPQLAEELERNPKLVKMIGPRERLRDVPYDLKAFIADLPDDLKKLFNDDEVVKVISGGSFNLPLLEVTIAQCAQIHGC